jgi:hypothetical protein
MSIALALVSSSRISPVSRRETVDFEPPRISPIRSPLSLATNALNHGLRAGPYDPVVPPELWIWRRITPAPQLVVAVFDALPEREEHTAP